MRMQKLMTLGAAQAIKQEMFLSNEPLTFDKIGQQWLAERVLEQGGEYLLEMTGVALEVIKNETQMIITVKEQ